MTTKLSNWNAVKILSPGNVWKLASMRQLHKDSPHCAAVLCFSISIWLFHHLWEVWWIVNYFCILSYSKNIKTTFIVLPKVLRQNAQVYWAPCSTYGYSCDTPKIQAKQIAANSNAQFINSWIFYWQSYKRNPGGIFLNFFF